MRPFQPTSRGRLWTQLLPGVGYLAMLAGVIGEVTDSPFLLVFAAVAFGAVSLCALTLVWITLWALRDNSRLGQFGIASILFLTVFVAVFFGVIRWLVDNSGFLSEDRQGIQTFASVGVVCLLVAVLAIPFLLLMTESLLWASVWLVRRDWIRRWLSRRRGL